MSVWGYIIILINPFSLNNSLPNLKNMVIYFEYP